MGFKLRREVRDALPAGLLTAAERLLVLELADWCNDDTRTGAPGAELLADLTDLSLRSVQQTLSRVAKKWVELRVPIGFDDAGRPYYSHPGRRTTFRFPKLAPARRVPEADASPAVSPPGGPTPEDAVRLADQTSPPGGLTEAELVRQADQADPDGATDRGAKVRQIGGLKPKMVRQMSGPSPKSKPLSQKPTSPPTPHGDHEPAGSDDAGLTTGWEGRGFDHQEQQRLDDLIAETLTLRSNDRRWTTRSIAAAINACLDDGKTLNDIEHALPLCASDPATASPGRLRLDFGPWWPSQPAAGNVCDDPGTEPAATRCPLHNRDRWQHCTQCLADVKAGEDPYWGWEYLRPAGWADIYLANRQTAVADLGSGFHLPPPDTPEPADCPDCDGSGSIIVPGAVTVPPCMTCSNPDWLPLPPLPAARRTRARVGAAA